jgi:hypothetical protein
VKRAGIAALILASAFAQSAGVPGVLTARPSADLLKADVSFLASDALQGRGTPSAGLDVAAEFIASQFRRARLEPIGDDGYFQTAQYNNITPNLQGLRLTLETSAGSIDATASGMGIQNAAGADLSHAAAFKADPNTLDTLTAQQVQGKVLVIDTSPGGGRGAFALARRIPAIAEKLRPVLVISLRTNGQGVNANTRLTEALATVPVLAVWDAKMREALGAIPSGAMDAKFTAHIAAPAITPVKLRNVIGVLRGSDAALKDTYVMLTAHYDHLGVRGSGPGDHIYNGANDDASGTASLIEIADALTSLRPKRSVLFMAVFGEELGLVGSRYYGQHPVVPLAKTIADLNLEQLGRTDDNTGPRVGVLNVTGFDYSSVTEVLMKAGAEMGIRVVKDEQASDAFFARSDNQALADAGIPAHTLSVGYEFPDYHDVGDEWPKLDYENMAKVDRAIALAVLRIADSTEVPQWTTGNPNTERYVKAHENLVGR